MNSKKTAFLLFFVFCLVHFSYAQKTNLLFVFTDQHSYDMVGYHKGSQVITPVIDQLASEGIQFSNCISSSPVCTPMRGMLMTGQHPLYNGCWKNDVPLLANNGTTFPQALNNGGYETAYIGKWHLYGGGRRDLGIPPGENRHGFNGTFLTDNVTVNYSAEVSFYWDDNGKKVFFKDIYEDKPWELEAQTRQAEEWLNEQDGEKPFALFVSWHPPHDFVGDGCADVEGRQYNYNVNALDPELIEPYKDIEIKLRSDLENDPIADCRKEQYRNYMAMITACDNALGRIIKILKEKGEYENTLIVFTSDHGDMLGSHGTAKPKQVPQDYSIKVPLVISGKSVIKKHRKSDLLIGSMDLMPTILGLLELEIPQTVQGHDLSCPILKGDDNAVKSVPIFMYTGNSWRGVYTKEWTYAEGYGPQHSKLAPTNVLYNHKDDPAQLNNLFDNEKYAAEKETLASTSKEWMERFRDTGYTGKDMMKIMSKMEWNTNYTRRPIDILENTTITRGSISKNRNSKSADTP